MTVPDTLPTDARAPSGDRAFSAQLHRIRDMHIEVESILQSLAALQGDSPCASCASVCCREAMCRESIDSDFLRFLLGPLAEGYGAEAGWHVPGSGCRLGHGRPLVCYEFFCEKFEGQEWARLKQFSRTFKTLYAQAKAGQHVLVVDDIGGITEHKLGILYGRLEELRNRASEALRQSLGEKLGMRPTGDPPAVGAAGTGNPQPG
jgi:hypothetical protein